VVFTNNGIFLNIKNTDFVFKLGKNNQAITGNFNYTSTFGKGAQGHFKHYIRQRRKNLTFLL